MAQFIKFNIVDTGDAAGLLAQGEYLLNSQHVGDVSYAAATGIVTVVLTAPAGGNSAAAGISARVLTSTVRTTTNGAAGVPTITDGASAPDKAIYRAMTANPGGVVATAGLNRDQAATPLQMYWTTWSIATVDDV
tara:strand:+ start:669 stop:1073 length:405 start_codon:yes stop_codon:yes gene_type:complete